MIYILSWTTKKHQNSVQATTFKVKESSRTFQGLAQKFKDFSRTSPNIQGLFKTVWTLFPYNFTLDLSNHVLSAWQIEKKKKHLLQSNTLNLFKNICVNPVFFVCYTFLFTSVHFKYNVQPCIVIKLCCFIPFSKYHYFKNLLLPLK